MKLKDVMTRSVETVRPDTEIKEVASKMKSLNVGVMPVCDENNRIVGLVTDRDITVRAIAEGHDPNSSRTSEIMTRDIMCGFEDQDIKEAASIMEQKQIRRMPVLDRNQQLVGIVSLGDLAVKTRDEKLAGEVIARVSEPSRPLR